MSLGEIQMLEAGKFQFGFSVYFVMHNMFKGWI